MINFVIRGFSTEMEKIASFRKKFLNTLRSSNVIPISIGATAGSALGKILAGRSSKKAREYDATNRKKENAKKLFYKNKKFLPLKTVLDTPESIERLIVKLGNKPNSAKDIRELKKLIKQLREGNAVVFSFPKNKYIITTNDLVSPSTMGHEMGHIIDWENTKRSKPIRKFVRHIAPKYFSERRAWDFSPIQPVDPKERKLALKTYSDDLLYSLVGSGIGGMVGLGTKKLLTRIVK